MAKATIIYPTVCICTMSYDAGNLQVAVASKWHNTEIFKAGTDDASTH